MSGLHCFEFSAPPDKSAAVMEASGCEWVEAVGLQAACWVVTAMTHSVAPIHLFHNKGRANLRWRRGEGGVINPSQIGASATLDESTQEEYLNL